MRNISIPKHVPPIALLSCISKTIEIIRTQMVPWAGKLTGAI